MEKKDKVVVRPDVDEEILPKFTDIKKLSVVSDRFVLQSVATQTDEIIVNKETNEEVNVKEALVKILNVLDELKKGLL